MFVLHFANLLKTLMVVVYSPVNLFRANLLSWLLEIFSIALPFDRCLRGFIGTVF